MSAVRRAVAAVATLLALAPAPTALAATPSVPLPDGPAATQAVPAPLTVPGRGATRKPYGPTRLVLTVSSSGVSRAGGPRTVTLTCDPAGGRHPDAREACDELTAANGGFTRLAATRGMCPMLFAPVTASASGTWRGTPVSWSREYANGCMLTRNTGAVFRF